MPVSYGAWIQFDYNSYIDSQTDEFQILDEIELLSSQLSIVALYRIVEIRIKSILSISSKFNRNEISSIFIFKILKEKLAKKFNIDIKSIKGFDSIDELRCLNNAIKHQNKVTLELSRFPDWHKGDELKDLSSAYKKFSHVVPIYLHDFADKISKYHKDTT